MTAYTVLSIDGQRLLLPRAEVRTLEPALDRDPVDPLPGTVGWLPFLGERWPLYCLNSALTLLTQVPPQRQISVLLSDDRIALALLCDQVTTLDNPQLRPQPVPVCMQLPNLPWESLVIIAERVECITNSQRLAARVGLITREDTVHG